MSKVRYRVCETCGQRIPHELWCYSSGDGALHFSWIEKCGPGRSADRIVTLEDVSRYLKSKKGKDLAAKGWVPFQPDGLHWVLAKRVQRTGKNRLKIDDETYYYEIDFTHFATVEEANLEVTFKMRVGPPPGIKGKYKSFECKNGSTRMVIRYFLNHEKALTELFKFKKGGKSMIH